MDAFSQYQEWESSQQPLRVYDPDTPAPTLIKAWDFVIDGFTRHEGRPDGMGLLWRKLNKFSWDQRCVEFKTWRQNWSDVADLVELFAAKNCGEQSAPAFPAVRIYGYSYGGYSAVMLARELHRRGIPVRALFLCDAVYRYPFAFGAWRSMVSWSRIIVPENVQEVVWFRQTNPRFALIRDDEWCGWERIAQPAGHDVVAADPTATRVWPVVTLGSEHTYIDTHPAVHERAIEVAAKP